eukprot:3352275-Amphidinium_carterae.1
MELARHSQEEVLPHVRTLRTLRCVLVAVAAALDKSPIGGPERITAFMHHFYSVLETVAKDPGHELANVWCQRSRCKSECSGHFNCARVYAFFELIM